ncbi:MAG: hypothetical protein MUF00_01575 [Gemmatimonadaceae bacterium]|nr:hypothetical protein [Gemmatimonadaceae bacterium]
MSESSIVRRHNEAHERLRQSARRFRRAQEKLLEGLEAWHREKTPHTEERLTHYYLVVRDCQRNLVDAEERLDEACHAVFESETLAIEAQETMQ